MSLFRRWRKEGQNRSTGKPLSTRIGDNLTELQRRFPHAPDLVIRRFQTKAGDEVALFYLENLVDKIAINDQVLRPLMYDLPSVENLDQPELPIGKTETASDWAKVEASLFEGKSILILEGHHSALLFFTQGWPQRAIQEPQVESTLKGGHQGFVETATQNLALIRTYLNHRELHIKKYTLGLRGNIEAYIVYLNDIVQPDYVAEMEDRIQQIHVDTVLNTGELEQYVEDHPFALFPQFLHTERPDTVVSQILQGRIAVLVDRSPFVMIGPATFTTFFQNVDDYSVRWLVASFLRLLRFFAFFIAISLPALYIAVISFHYEVIPFDLMLSIATSRVRVPFPPILEALLMEAAIEMIREAGVRLPSPVGQTIGVVGGIVVGQAAVQAGIVSNIMVIIVAITAISSFIIPNHDMAFAVRLVRFPMMLIASLFGMVGIAIGLIVLFVHIINMESLGQPYGSPFAPTRLPDWKDTWIRVPLWKMNTRPLSPHPLQRRRQGQTRKGEDD
ncbi:spore germination protein [Salinithrix halophila]|uniref:Spore germination protein n=1 Tax=Salinithrix halophila TaxID=1485204 RepID=A0ABV8JEP9_9BACL